MLDIGIRVYMLAGMLAHKILWEVLKRAREKPGAASPTAESVGLRLVKLAKLALLLGFIAQTAIPIPVLPILTDPLALQLAGLVLYTLGLATAISARLRLGSNWSDIEEAGVLREQRVSADGIYGLIRHPIYVGDLLLLFGLQLALNSWLVLLIAAMTPYVLWKAVQEERMLMESLPGYEAYCRTTKRFIPYVV